MDDFIRRLGIISPAAATYAKAAIAGVKRDLHVYRRRDIETTAKDWSTPTVEEMWHSHVQIQSMGILSECWDLARMLRHDPPILLIVMATYHRLLPAVSREEDDPHQNVKEPVVGDHNGDYVSENAGLDKSRKAIEADVSTLMNASDKILAVFNQHNTRQRKALRPSAQFQEEALSPVWLYRHWAREEHHIVAFEGASPLMPFAWLFLLAGWLYIPSARIGRLHVEVKTPQSD